MRYWHVADQAYRSGSPLVAPSERQRVRSNCDGAPEDAPTEDAVELFISRKKAEQRLAEAGGVLLLVELPDPPTKVSAYHRRWRHIPGAWVRVVGDVAEKRAA